MFIPDKTCVDLLAGEAERVLARVSDITVVPTTQVIVGPSIA